MAKKADGESSTTWISLSVARDLATPVILSPRFAEAQIMKWLHYEKIGWRYITAYGLPRQGRTKEQEADKLWLEHPERVLIEWRESFARKDLQKGVDGKILYYVIVVGIEIVREDLERMLKALRRDEVAEVPSPAQPIVEPIAGAKWIADEAKRMKAARAIPSLQSEFARELDRRMHIAAETDRSIRPLKASYIENQLRSWGLWPASTIK
jgi:hypothetical protein